MPAYYPSCVVNFKLRFDESVVEELLVAMITGELPLSMDDMSKASDAPAIGISSSPTMTRESPPFSFVMGRVPTHASIELPGYRQAGQFDIEVPFKHLPIDPQTVRAGAVEIYLGTVEAQAFASGMSLEASSANLFGRGSVLRTRDAAGQPIQKNLVMVGLIDEWTVEHGDKGSVAKMRGRDLRGALIDTPVATTPEETEKFFDKMNMTEDIVGVVQAILAMNPLFAEIQVKTNDAEWPDGEIPSPASDAAVPRHRKGAKGDKKRKASSGKSSVGELHLWDLIIRECYLVGAIPYFEGTDLWIRPARSIFDQKRAGADPAKNPTPFAGGKKRTKDEISGKEMEPLAVRKLVYGRDTKVMTFDRKFGGYQRPKIVRVITVDQSSDARGQDRTLVAQWPPEDKTKAQVTRVSPGADASQTEFLNIPVCGIRDKDQLLEIAKAVFEEIGRGELGGSCESPNCASFGGDNKDPDLLRLKPGDGVEFSVDTRALTQTAPLITTLTDSQRQPLGKVIKELTDLTGDRLLAKTIAASARSARAQRFFRVSNVKYSWTNTSGIKVVFDFQNYVVARNEAGSVSTSDGSVVKRKVPKKQVGFGL